MGNWVGTFSNDTQLNETRQRCESFFATMETFFISWNMPKSMHRLEFELIPFKKKTI